MGYKIFVSYKYADDNVKNISGSYSKDTVRTYVNYLSEYIKDKSDHIYKGEGDNEDLSVLGEETIWAKLKNKIYDSTLTIIMISKGMREPGKKEKDQWIPWEISYSLKEISRKNINNIPVTSRSNALLAVILPDKDGLYDYFVSDKNCCSSGCRMYQTNVLFPIIKENMFNMISPAKKICNANSEIYYGDCSYITSVKWDDFIKSPENYIEKAYEIQNNIELYDIKKEL